MLNIYKKEQDIPKDIKIIKWNDIYFNQYTCHLMDNRAESIIRQIDGAEWKRGYQIISELNNEIINIDKLSSGCKTALNILYNTGEVFSLKECGDNALDVIYTENKGNVYCDYPVISLNLSSVVIHDKGKEEIMNSYEKLKEWWEDV